MNAGTSFRLGVLLILGWGGVAAVTLWAGEPVDDEYALEQHEIPSRELLESFDKATLTSLCLNLYNRIALLERELQKKLDALTALTGDSEPPAAVPSRPAQSQPPTPPQQQPLTRSEVSDDPPPLTRQQARTRVEAPPEPMAADPAPSGDSRTLPPGTDGPMFTSITEIIGELPKDMLPAKSARVWSEVQSELATAWLNRNLRGRQVELRANLDITQPMDDARLATFRADRVEFDWLLVRETKITGSFDPDQANELRQLQSFTPCLVRGTIERMIIRGSPGMPPLTGQIPTFFNVQLSKAEYEPYQRRSAIPR